MMFHSASRVEGVSLTLGTLLVLSEGRSCPRCRAAAIRGAGPSGPHSRHGRPGREPTPSKRRAQAGPGALAPAPRGGASLDELAGATGWLPHTTRAALTGLRKKGHAHTRRASAGLSIARWKYVQIAQAQIVGQMLIKAWRDVTCHA